MVKGSGRGRLRDCDSHHCLISDSRWQVRSGRGGGGGGGRKRGGGGGEGGSAWPSLHPVLHRERLCQQCCLGHRHPSAESPPAWLISIPRPEISDTNISARSSEPGSSVSTPLPGNNLPISLPSLRGASFSHSSAQNAKLDTKKSPGRLVVVFLRRQANSPWTD